MESEMSSALEKTITTIARNAKKASLLLQSVPEKQVNKSLLTMASLLTSEKDNLQRANRKDLAAARKKGLSTAMIDRLTLSDKTIGSMIRGLEEVARISSPVGTEFDERTRPNGLKISKVKVPIGVVGIIYESRPNVTVDAAAICLKSQNAVILRGGSESFHSNKALTALFKKAMVAAKLPDTSVQIIPTIDRAAIDIMLKMDQFIDLVIPRGGESLIRAVVEKSHIPVIKHYKGICHVYISPSANLKTAASIAVNAKVQRPGVCNAMETLLLDERMPATKRKKIIQALLDNGVTLFGDPKSRELSPEIKKATTGDWYEEYLDLRLAVRTVKHIDEAIDHINTFGSHHTDAIVSGSKRDIAVFLKQVDSSSVIINASTRFSDGGEYGMGCEIGISTDKLHARGPMGVEDLTTYKWVVLGKGQIRS